MIYIARCKFGSRAIEEYSVSRLADLAIQLGLHFGEAPTIDTDLFIGRSSELCTIQEILHPSSSLREQRRVLVGGLGGVGKTQLAIAYARQYHRFYDSIFWLNASKELSLQASFRRVAGLFVNAQDLAQLDNNQVRARVHEWLTEPQNTKWLLVFDNYDDPQEYDIREYCPYARHGSILITTRVLDLVHITGGHLRVKPFSDIKESLQILQSRSQRDGVQSNPQARCLAQRLAGLPLALATAGAYLRKTTVTFEQYLQAYEQRININPGRPIQLQEYANRTLHTTWDLSYCQLQKTEQNMSNGEPSAAKMLRLLACFDNQEVWFELIHAGLKHESPQWLQETVSERIDFENVMSTLVDYCLLETNLATQSYSVHQCVHDWMLEELNRNVNAQLYWYAFDCVGAGLDRYDWEALGHAKYTRISQHGIRLIHPRFTVCDESNADMSELLEEAVWVAETLKEQIQLPKAEQMYLRALAWHEKALGSDHASTLDIVNNLGNLYRGQGKLKEAEQMYPQALAGREKALGPDHTSTLHTVNNLGVLYFDQGKLEAAEQMYERALAGRKKALGSYHTLTLITINNLGASYHAQDKLEEAERMLLRALAGYEKGLGSDHTSTLDIVNNLGILYADQRKLGAAEQMYLRALAGYETVLGPDYTSTLDIFITLTFCAASVKLARA